MAATYNLDGKVALVTGSARGIGFETARALAGRGASVAVNDLDGPATEAAASAIGSQVLAVPADVTDREEMNAAVAAVVGRFGGLDVVVANAGVAPPSTTMRTIDPDVFERTLEIDLFGVWRTVRPALPQIVERKGHVVVVSSVYAWVNGMMNAPYAVAKSGVEAMGRALRSELAIHGASATVAHFGFINTKMVQNAFEDEAVRSSAEQRFPRLMLRRLSPSYAAAAVVDGIERRAPRVIVPPWWRAWFTLRGVINPLLDRVAVRDETSTPTTAQPCAAASTAPPAATEALKSLSIASPASATAMRASARSSPST
jgi:NAD(P)-dependent dehydrogenase (short-subunit alcohol dehydrogenase family)